jgi:DNA-binding protein
VGIFLYNRFPDEEDVEALCKFLATVGKKFDTPKTTSIMNIVISRMVELSEDKKLLSRGRFLLKDVLEMRDYMWEPRRQELQQKTLEEVRKEAERLQKLGKNAQHDNFSSRRKKTSISSAQLAKQSSNLLLKKSTSPKESGRALGSAAKGEEVKNQQTTSSTPPSPSLEPFESGDLSSEDRSRYTARIKNIINEYLSIEDLEEASACVREELPLASHADFAEQAINIALDGKEKERESAVQLLVGLYEKGALDATSIQNAIVLVVEFLEDMKIDIPLIHEYSALIYGRLIAAGCFGFSWMLGSLEHVTECGLTSLIFAEVIGVIETEHGNDEDAEEEEEAEEAVASIIRMLTDEEITPEMVLPSSKRTPENIHQFLEEHELEEYFNDEEEEDVSEEEEDVEEYDPEMETRMKNTLDEYLSVKDFEELLTCLNEFQSQTQRANAKFAQMAILKAVDARENVREEIAQTLIKLVEVNQLNASEVEQAFEPVLLEYDDFLVDIPKIADNLCQLWLTFFIDKLLTFDWLFAVIDHLVRTYFIHQ